MVELEAGYEQCGDVDEALHGMLGNLVGIVNGLAMVGKECQEALRVIKELWISHFLEWLTYPALNAHTHTNNNTFTKLLQKFITQFLSLYLYQKSNLYQKRNFSGTNIMNETEW